MMFHDGEMHGIPCRQLPMPQDNLFRTFGDGPIHGQHLIDDAEQGVKRRLDCVAAVDGNVAVQDLLKHFGIRNEALPVADQFLEQALRVALMRMRRTNEIHRDVGVDQNHGCAPVTYPPSISASMESMSPAG